MLAKKTAKNQGTLPKEIADRFPDTVYFDVRVEGRKITLRPVRIETEGEEQDPGRIREKMRGPGGTGEGVTGGVRGSGEATGDGAGILPTTSSSVAPLRPAVVIWSPAMRTFWRFGKSRG